MKRFAETIFFLTLSAASVLSEMPAAAERPQPDGAAGEGRLVKMDGVFLEPLQERDSVLIADQLRYGFRLDGVDENVSIAIPVWDDSLLSPMEMLTPWTLDTVRTHGGGRKGGKIYDIEGSVVLAAFDEGHYELPPVFALRAAPGTAPDTLSFGSLAVDVKTLPIDTASFVIHDIRGQIRYPLTFREVLPYLAGFLAAAALAVLTVVLIKRRKGKSSSHENDEPAHITALRKLDKFRGDGYWEPERQKIFYSGVTDAIREYMAARWGIAAMEMTTAEIFDAMKGKGVPSGTLEDMKALFERADFVKFAKHVASREENASVIPASVRFVTETYQEQLDEEAADVVKE